MRSWIKFRGHYNSGEFRAVKIVNEYLGKKTTIFFLSSCYRTEKAVKVRAGERLRHNRNGKEKTFVTRLRYSTFVKHKRLDKKPTH